MSQQRAEYVTTPVADVTVLPARDTRTPEQVLIDAQIAYYRQRKQAAQAEAENAQRILTALQKLKNW